MIPRSALRSSIHLAKQVQPILPRVRYFHPSPAAMVKVGDSVPKVDLFQNSPGNKVDLASELSSGKGIIIGVPAAFSPSCSDTHIPGYLASHKLESAGKVYVVSVNDAFVMKAWAKSLDAEQKSGIQFLADPAGDFTQALDLMFDAKAFFGNDRGKRFALKVEDGKITKVSVEEDPSKVTVSSAEENL